ncbi:MAG TPA: monofunctional biosynthetic peptidoglycan transglycosylase [bacterium]|nr:monofunctional biosynthetic peptidoglycan transglycosylase [bacterium]HQG46100.1 monofunctional biosynthetic peptidoglycan transglycosylase [bacterium]HQI49929.1 monofunctional biosynthetic peptidoglycan transglycosylase [bacterium]HQJ64474.1 monofunctional biosynthetic peptidoglycan transglycosylase [bacterium]
MNESPSQNPPAEAAVVPAKRRWLLWIPAALLLGTLLFLLITWLTLPDVTALNAAPPKATAMMAYREKQAGNKGVKLRRAYIWIPGRQISGYLRDAVLIAEDDKFFQHQGFDWEEMRQAMEKNREKGKVVRGGSTITQQLAKNLYLNPSRTPWRKVREALIAREMEKKLSKWRILELYLNVIEWGDGVYGAEAAARAWFHKSAAELTPAEAIRLASVIINPRRYSPLNNTNQRMRNRRLMLAERMYQRNLFDAAVYEALRLEFAGS